MDQQGDADENGTNSLRFSLLASQREGEREGGEDPSSEVYSHPSITRRPGREEVFAKELGKAKPRRKLSRAVVVVRQPKRYKRSRQSRLDSNLSL